MSPDPTRVDLHVKILDESVVARAKARGIDLLVYAPHFTRFPTIRERAARFTDADLTVVPAREIFTGTWRNRKHLLAIGLTDPVPDFISLSNALAELDRQNAAVLIPHPTFLTVSLGPEDIRTYRDAFHGIEVFNPKHLPFHNRRARELADRFEIPAFASSYAHLRGSVGAGWTVFDDLEPSEQALVGALRASEPRSVSHGHGLPHWVQCTAEIAHLLYENSWQKFNRVVLSGMEATHPDHPVYENRFEPE